MWRDTSFGRGCEGLLLLASMEGLVLWKSVAGTIAPARVVGRFYAEVSKL